MLGLDIWQGFLDGLGWVLSSIYDLVPNYGVTIIILTVVIRLLLLPLGIKQIKSMQHMQAIQPKIKDLQKKFKGNKQKIQEETMRLYKEAGVNPLGGCLPLLLQFPILIAMYSVIRAPDLRPAPETSGAFQVANSHLPEDGELFRKVVLHENGGFLFLDLQCTVMGAGTSLSQTYKDPADGQMKELPTGATILGEEGGALGFEAKTVSSHDCGDSRFPDIVPYALLLVIMIGSTYYQQFQMQKASPPGSQSQQQQTIMRVMPLMFAFFGLTFPAGLVLYWTTSNLFQIGQQAFLLRAGHIGPDALERRMAEQRERMANKPEKQGFMARMMERAETAQDKGGKAQTGGKGSAKPTRSPKKSDPKAKGDQTPSGGKGGGKGGKSGKSGKSGKGSQPGNQLKKRRTPWTEG